ncbi:MAG TPA: DUF4180 domain-containing protein [Ktedonobacteraceae bacterium]|nr:DUF4180 domain-containing protein [Ktedonobacteraceae bacterium]
MSNTLTTIQEVQVLICTPDGEKLKSEREAIDLIGEALQQGAQVIVIPVKRLNDDFFSLKTRIAGEIIQKFVTYRRQLVILGDISRYVEQSKAFRDFVYETNRGIQVWFLRDFQELAERLKCMR